jgi:hypothetical protein
MQKQILAVVFAIGILCGCKRDAPPTTMPIHTLADFDQALKTAGVEVRALESDIFELPDTELQTWEVRGESMHIFSFNELSDHEKLLERLSDPEVQLVEDGQDLQIWERASFMVVYPGSDGGLVLLISGLLGDPTSREISGPDEPYPPAVSAAQHVLADELGISPAEVQVLDYEDVLWPDSCLGVVAPNEDCAQEETAGWRIELNAVGKSYVLHSDAIGHEVKLAE